MVDVRELYPDLERNDRSFYGPYDYEPMLESFGEIVLKKDDQDYQGDSYVLYRKEDFYGVLIFGWGSCSGCDALQACSSYEDIEELRSSLEQSIEWGTLEQTIDYFERHDWEGDYSWHSEECREFVKEATQYLREKL